MPDVLEERMIILSLLVGIVFLILFIISKLTRSEKKRRLDRIPDSIYLAVVLVILFVFWLPYASARPAQPFSIVIFVVSLLLMIGVMGQLILRPLRRVDPFLKCGIPERITRIAIVLVSYAFAFAFAEIGLAFVFLGILRPESVPLTPELVRYVLPAIAGSTLIVFRLSQRFVIEPLEILSRISEDIILASLGIYVYVAAAGYVGVEIQSLYGFGNPDFGIGLLVAAFGLGLEFWISRVDHALKLAGKARVADLWTLLSLEVLLLYFKHDRQTTLDDFSRRRHRRRANKVVRELDRRVHFRLFGKIVKGSHLLMLFLLASLPIGVYLNMRIPVRVMVPAYSAEVLISPESANTRIMLSDELEGLTYAVRLAKVVTTNSSFVAPLSSRLVSLNSSQFLVTWTGEYLVLRLHIVRVEYVVMGYRIRPLAYDQMNNSQFEYYSIYRDAEIYYALRLSGYSNITTLCMTSMNGMMTSNIKLTHAVKEDHHVLLQTKIEGETVKTDETIVESTDKELSNLLVLELNAAKISTHIEIKQEEPVAPFAILQGIQTRRPLLTRFGRS